MSELYKLLDLLYQKSFSKEERQTKGKVYTGQEIVTWIHDKLAEQSPLSLDKTYCDFACGTGHFPLDWYDRLMLHWEANKDKYPAIKDRQQAHRHIVEHCLYFADIDPFAVRLCRMGLYLKDPSVLGLKFNAFVGDSLLGEPFGDKKFDYVAGNPPYISFRNGGLQGSYKERLRDKYTYYSGSGGDVLNLFIELAAQRGAYGGLITSRYWIETPSLAKMREHLCDHVVAIWDHGNQASQFGGAFVMTACFVFDFTRVLSSPLKINEIEKRRDVLGKAGWHLMDDAICSKLDKCPPLTKFAEVSDGVYTGDVEVFLVDAATAQRLGIEQKAVGGENVRQWYVESERFLVPQCTAEEYRQQLSPVAQYLKQHEKQLLARGCTKLPFEYRAKNPEWYNGKDGILARFYMDYKHYGFAPKGKVIGLNGNVFLIEPQANLQKVLLAILNSKLMEYYFSVRQKRRANNFMVTMSSYKKLPVPECGQEEAKVLDPLVDKMLANPDDTATQAEIDKIVYELYGLTKEEIKVVEEAVGEASKKPKEEGKGKKGKKQINTHATTNKL